MSRPTRASDHSVEVEGEGAEKRYEVCAACGCYRWSHTRSDAFRRSGKYRKLTRLELMLKRDKEPTDD